MASIRGPCHPRPLGVDVTSLRHVKTYHQQHRYRFPATPNACTKMEDTNGDYEESGSLVQNAIVRTTICTRC